jgi:D-glycero-alpha-D-manno-heptose-7-phosphate kinase
VSYGGFNHISFRDGQYSVSPVVLRPQVKHELEKSLVLLYAGKSRIAEEIEAKKMVELSERENELTFLHQLVKEGLNVLHSTNFCVSDFGRLLNEGWTLKKRLAREVSNSTLDEIYDTAMRNGAYGGKLLGAGGGGFFLFCVDAYDREQFIRKMSQFLHVPFRFEYGGSKIALYDPS